MNDFKNIKVAVAGTGYVGLSIATLLSQHHHVTAVANGRCTSAPSPCESAIGKKPIEATRAVIKTGRKRTIQLSMMR